MSGQLATSETILVSAAGVIAADSAGLSSVKSYSALLTSIAAMPLAGGTFTGHVLFTDNTYDIGASGATRPRTVYVGTSVVTPVVSTASGTLVLSPATNVLIGTVTDNGTGARLQVDGWITSTGTIRATNRVNIGSVSTAAALQVGGSQVGAPSLGSTTNALITWTAASGAFGLSAGYENSGDFWLQSMRNDSAVAYALKLQPAGGSVVIGGTTTCGGPVSCGVYTFATVPTASSYSGSAIRISDRSQQWAYSDGTDWRFFVDGAVIS